MDSRDGGDGGNGDSVRKRLSKGKTKSDCGADNNRRFSNSC